MINEATVADYCTRCHGKHSMKDDCPSWFYMSFAGDEGFRGGLYAQGKNLEDACKRAHSAGINPGGEVMGIPIKDPSTLPHPDFRNRLLTRSELEGSLSEGDELASLADGDDVPSNLPIVLEENNS